MLSEMGVNVVNGEDEAPEAEGGEVAVREESAVAETPKEAAYDRTDDPVRMYLREMGSVELLSREGEIAIAKRIEAGRDTMIRGLCESALTFEAIMVWRDELTNGRILLREIIDLEADLRRSREECAAGAAPEAAPADEGSRWSSQPTPMLVRGRSAIAAPNSRTRTISTTARADGQRHGGRAARGRDGHARRGGRRVRRLPPPAGEAGGGNAFRAPTSPRPTAPPMTTPAVASSRT